MQPSLCLLGLQDFSYHAAEIDDTDEDLLSHYPACEAFIDQARSSGGTVLVHWSVSTTSACIIILYKQDSNQPPSLPLSLCSNAGISRSASIALAYVMHKERLSLEQAYDRLRLTRSKIRPNTGFMEQLTDIQHKLGIS